MLFAVVFLWTPPHFWSLSLFVNSDYAAAGIPMMSVVAGARSTRRQLMLYSIAMAGVALAPWWFGLTGSVYGWTALLLNAVFLIFAARTWLSREADPGRMFRERQMFAYSIFYLFGTFAALVADRLANL